MAIIEIQTTQEERDKVLTIVKKYEDKTIAVSQLAKEAKLPHSKVRYVLYDLEEANIIKRIPVKAINKYYIRYKYRTVKE